MSKKVCDFKSQKVAKTLIFYTHTHTHTHTCNHCQEEKIAYGDFNRIGQEGDSEFQLLSKVNCLSGSKFVFSLFRPFSGIFFCRELTPRRQSDFEFLTNVI